MFLSEWREFPSAPCLAGKKKTWWQLASRCCWNRARRLTCYRACFLPGRAKDVSAPRYIGLHVKYLLLLSDFNPLNAELNPICHLLGLLGSHHILHVSRIRVNETWIVSTDFQKNNQISNVMIIRKMWARFFRTDRGPGGRTDSHDEAYSR